MDVDVAESDHTGTVLRFRPLVLRAVELAGTARRRGDHPFGAVLLDPHGEVLAEGLNGVVTTGDLRAHAELEALENARRAGRSGQVAGGIMIASGEPCPMCTAGLVWAGLSQIVFAAATPNFVPYLPDGPRFRLRCADVVAASTAEIVVSGPVDGVDALAPFRPGH
ncbi:nucleoside deaminase [Kineosporia sp. J2-2]|uniref:Nucleoside deaminase n=1 Tax=Kineosporia corallincola TaxID=2835133 RepID=A0ABS5TPG4_9ACTN|nr:nucleoside deaminase [Kineosporia corallincola]MBT0772999.1 nucleoside deaminase [Kineosporia corallincola]